MLNYLILKNNEKQFFIKGKFFLTPYLLSWSFGLAFRLFFVKLQYFSEETKIWMKMYSSQKHRIIPPNKIFAYLQYFFSVTLKKKQNCYAGDIFRTNKNVLHDWILNQNIYKLNTSAEQNVEIVSNCMFETYIFCLVTFKLFLLLILKLQYFYIAICLKLVLLPCCFEFLVL